MVTKVDLQFQGPPNRPQRNRYGRFWVSSFVPSNIIITYEAGKLSHVIYHKEFDITNNKRFQTILSTQSKSARTRRFCKHSSSLEKKLRHRKESGEELRIVLISEEYVNFTQICTTIRKHKSRRILRKTHIPPKRDILCANGKQAMQES